MWESRGFCEISKERWEEGKSRSWISTLSATPPFPQLSSFPCPASYASDTSVRFLDGSIEIARHIRTYDRHQLVLDPLIGKPCCSAIPQFGRRYSSFVLRSLRLLLL